MYVLGLYSDGEYFKVVLINRRGKKSRIEFIKEFKKNISSLNRLKKILDSKMGLFWGGVEVVSALPPEDVFVKKFVYPMVSRAKVKKALKFEISSDPMYSDESRVFVPTYKKEKDETEVVLYGYTKEAMNRHLQNIKTLGIESDWTSVVSRGIERFSEFFTNESQPYLIFHLGWESSLFYSMKNGVIDKEASFKVGMKNIIDAMTKDQLITDPLDMEGIQHLFLDTIERREQSACMEVFVSLERHLSKIWAFMVSNNKKEMFYNKILFTGYAEFSRELKEFLPPLSLEEVKIIPHIEYSARSLASYAIEIGLALDRVISGNQTLQLGEGQFIPFGQKRKARRYIYGYAAMSSLSAMIVFSTFNGYFIKKSHYWKKRYTELVSEINGFNVGKKIEVSFKKGDLIRNRAKCVQLVKKQKKVQRLKRGPFLVTSVMELLKNLGIDARDLLNLEYKVLEGPTKKNATKGFVVQVSFQRKEFTTDEELLEFQQQLDVCGKGISFKNRPEITFEEDGLMNVTMTVRG